MTRQEAITVLVACHQVRMQAGLHVIVVNDLDLCLAQRVTVVSVNLMELPHDGLEAVAVSPSIIRISELLLDRQVLV